MRGVAFRPLFGQNDSAGSFLLLISSEFLFCVFCDSCLDLVGQEQLNGSRCVLAALVQYTQPWCSIKRDSCLDPEPAELLFVMVWALLVWASFFLEFLVRSLAIVSTRSR